MHELGIVTQVVEIAAERTHGAKVKRLVLEIGRLSMVVPDSLRFCFDLATADTTLEHALLEIVEVDGIGIRIIELEVS